MYPRIEFMGLAGAGKTTCGQWFLNELRACYSEVFTREEAVIQCIRRRDDGIIRNVAKRFPAIVWEPLSGMRNALAELNQYACANRAMMARIFQTLDQEAMPDSSRECIVFNFLQLVAEHQLLLNHLQPNAVLFAEEGFAQVGSMLYGYLPSRTLPEEAIGGYLDQLPALQAVIWIDTDPALCLERLRMRPAKPIVLQKDSDQESLDFLKQAQQCFQVIADGLTQRGIPLHRVEHTTASANLLPEELKRIARKILLTCSFRIGG